MKDGSSAAMEMLGEVYLSNGQNDEAKALFSSYLSTDGFAAAANNGLALCALAENDTDSALSYIEERTQNGRGFRPGKSAVQPDCIL